METPAVVCMFGDPARAVSEFQPWGESCSVFLSYGSVLNISYLYLPCAAIRFIQREDLYENPSPRDRSSCRMCAIVTFM